MAKKNKELTLEFLDADIARSTDIVGKLRAEYQALGQSIMVEVKKLEKFVEQRVAFVPLTLETALETYLPTGENSPGYKWLNERSNKGDWAGTGFGYAGSYWTSNNQRCLGVRIPDSKFTDAQLDRLAEVIEEVMPSLKTNCFEDARGHLALTGKQKDSKVLLSSLKVLDITDGGLCEYSCWRLAQMEDGQWLVFDEYRAKYGNGLARITGTLMECLKEIRTYMNCDNGSEDSDAD